MIEQRDEAKTGNLLGILAELRKDGGGKRENSGTWRCRWGRGEVGKKVDSVKRNGVTDMKPY